MLPCETERQPLWPECSRFKAAGPHADDRSIFAGLDSYSDFYRDWRYWPQICAKAPVAGRVHHTRTAGRPGGIRRQPARGTIQQAAGPNTVEKNPIRLGCHYNRFQKMRESRPSIVSLPNPYNPLLRGYGAVLPPPLGRPFQGKYAHAAPSDGRESGVRLFRAPQRGKPGG